MSAMNSSAGSKAEGDISDTFASLSGRKAQPLPDRFRELKLRLVNGHEDAVIASWKRLLTTLRTENDLIARTGPAIIPEVRFSHLQDDLDTLKPEIKKRGVAVIRGVIPEDEARAYKFEIEEYARQNPQTKGFPPSNPQVLELYWSPAQIRARAHPSLLQTQAALLQTLWHVSDPMFRMFQGWLAISRSGPGRGTLLVNPLVRESGVYSLLRPFFGAKRTLEEVGGDRTRYLEEGNWEFLAGDRMTSELQGAMPGCAQEFTEGLHPHLALDRTMVHVPEVRPGDYVVWHCDTIHAVDKKHDGTSDSSVLYIPVCPTTKDSAEYVARQRTAFLQGTPAPDFPGGEGESRHIGRATEEYVKKYCDPVGVQSMGLDKLATAEGDTPGGKAVVEQANKVLGF
ncbi:hypothetical protein C8A00DRAFT_19417 [Chaetomidium leptoderma]|uniref:DUF1479-domain-containing protein n=1 Tax=Chaetomidium leptoderma TaxID=669021 RepID=A0AAN6VCB0_9PEZI|nr:hypothetical protein C8A00DRAFT_19417 [Chaetomidium leptoderma]